MYRDLVKRKTKIEKQLLEISQTLTGLEEEMGKLQSTMEEPNKTESAETQALLTGSPTPTSGTKRETKEAEEKDKDAIIIPGEEQEYRKAGGRTLGMTKTEDKTARIERLKSGFTICKPQGSFLWPNMATTSQVEVQLEDLIVVPTPPSVSSSSKPPSPYNLPSQHNPQTALAVKPLAERKSVTLSTVINRPSPPPLSPIVVTASTPNTIDSTLINLNEVPSNQNDAGFFGSQSHSTLSSNLSFTYQRRYQNVTTGPGMSCVC